MASSVEALEKYLEAATRQLYAADPNTVTVNFVRLRAEEQNDLEQGFFVTQDWKARSKTLITELVQKLLTNDPASSPPESKVEKTKKHGVKRSSSDEPSSPPAVKRQKKTSVPATSRNSKLKKEPSSSALSELSDSDVEPKKETKNASKKKKAVTTKKAATTKKTTRRKQESDPELSDLGLSEEEPKQKKAATTKRATKRKQESDSELSDLDVSEEEPKPIKTAKKPAASSKSKKGESESELSDLSSSEDKPKPTTKRGRNLKKLDDSDDSGKDGHAESSTSRLKRKQPAVAARQTAKRTKFESDSEEKTNVDTKAEENDAGADLKIDGDAAAKEEDSEEDAKLDRKETKPAVDDSDSSLSSVPDEPPLRKQKGKGPRGTIKPKKSAPKELTGDEAEIKKLQGQLVKCGVRKIWGFEMKKYGSDSKAKIRHLRDMLHAVGMDGRFSEAKAREIKERRELIGELEAVNEMNELWGLEGRKGRASRSKVVRKSLKEESEEEDDNVDDNKQKPKAEEDDDDVQVATSSRVSKRMADLAFLGSESESE
ncbi:hypothetical protein F5B18DRAFT_608527 [Nemania serpens]|nr:hypothetical protein F5B18DRAFT_608527 [Nemania serpens]